MYHRFVRNLFKRTFVFCFAGCIFLQPGAFCYSDDTAKEVAIERELQNATGKRALELHIQLVEIYGYKNPTKGNEYAEKAQALLLRQPDPRLKARLLIAWAGTHRQMGKYPEAQACLVEARREAEILKDNRLLARILKANGAILRRMNRFDDALERYQQAAAIYRELGDAASEAGTLRATGIIHKSAGRYEEAKRTYRQGLDLAELSGDPRVTAQLYSSLSILNYVQGAYQEALTSGENGLDHCRKHPDCDSEIGILNTIALTYAALGDLDTALTFYSSTLEAYRQKNHAAGVALTLSNISAVHYEMGNFEDARTYLEEMVSINARINNKRGLYIGHRNLAALHLELGNLGEARKYLDKAMAPNGYRLTRRHSIAILDVSGRLAMATQQYDAALEAFREVKTLNEALNNETGIVDVLLNLAGVSLATNKVADAVQYLEEAERRAQELDSKSLLRDIYLEKSRCWEQRGDLNQALQCHKKYLALREAFLQDEKEVAAKRLDERIEIVRREREIDVLKKDNQIQSLMLLEEKATSQLYAIWLVVALLIGLVAFLAYSRYAQSRLLRQKEKHNKALEEKVQERTAQLRKRMDELETFEELVRTINQEFKFEAVINALLKQGTRLLPECRGVGFLRNEPTPVLYTTSGRKNLDDDIPPAAWPVPVAAEDTLADGIAATQLDDDYPYLNAWRRLQLPEQMVVADIQGENRSYGFLIFEMDPAALTDGDLEQLERFREHAILAFTKAAIIEELAEAQEDFTEAAHLAGMAEVAGVVLHNLGNTLNSVRTSLHVMEGELGNRRPLDLLTKIHDIFVDHREALAGLSDQTALEKLPGALKSISKSWNQQIENLETENRRLDECVLKIQTILAEQHQVAHARFEKHTDLKSLIEKLVHRERHRTFAKSIEILCDLDQLPPVTLNRFKLHRILTHLLQNAYQAIEASDSVTSGEVVISASQSKDSEVTIIITDNGEGFSQREHHKLFEYGFTTRPGRHGSGLHYAANALAGVKGAIQINSDGPDLGASVVIHLPIAEDLAA